MSIRISSTQTNYAGVKGKIPPSLAEDEQPLSQNTPAKSQREMDEVEEVDEEDDDAHSGDEGDEEVTF